MSSTVTWSDAEPSRRIERADELERFIDECEDRSEFPVAISLDAHGYRADLLVGHERSFVHLAPETEGAPYFVTVGDPTEGVVDFWFQLNHHTQSEARHFVEKAAARAAFVEFFRTGERSSAVRWERYEA